MRALLFVGCLLFARYGPAQNLIPYGGFEFAETKKYLYEYPPYLKTHRTRDATSVASNAYLRSRAELVDSSYAGAHCVYVYTSHQHRDKDGRFRSFIQVKLSAPVEPDSLYTFSAAVCNNNANPYLPKTQVYLMTKNVYSRGPFDLSLPAHQRLELPMRQMPGWQTTDARFRADAAYTFLLIGEAEAPIPALAGKNLPDRLRPLLVDELRLVKVGAQIPPPDLPTAPPPRETILYFAPNAVQPTTVIDWTAYAAPDRRPTGVTIAAYADARGREADNDRLSRQRAEAVRASIRRQLDLPEALFKLAWYGEADCGDTNAACRRAEVRFTYQ